MTATAVVTEMVDHLAGVNPRTIGSCSWCRAVVRWVMTPSSTDRDGNLVKGTVLAVDPAPVLDGDILIHADGGTATILTGTDIRPSGSAYRAHHGACANSPRIRAAVKVAQTTDDGRPRCQAYRCRLPGKRLDLVLAGLGETTHPCCDAEGYAAQYPRESTCR